MNNPKRLMAILVIVVSTGLVMTAPAGAASLTWSQVKAFSPACVNSGLDCTALGVLGLDYPDMGLAADGSQTATNGAVGPTVDKTSPEGATYDVAFPSVDVSAFAGTSAANLSGVAKFSGTITRTVFGLVHTFENPLVILRGDGTGAIYVSGDAQGTPYVGQLFELDLDGLAPNPSAPVGSPGLAAGYPAAMLTDNGDGTSTISGIVPSVPGDTTAIGGAYYDKYNRPGIGPDRIPNIFGAFSLRVATPRTTVTGQPPPIAPDTTSVVRPAKFTKYKVKKAPFGKRAKRVLARVTRKGKLIGYAEVSGRTVRYIGTVGKLKGTYRLSEVGGKKRKATVRFS